MIKNKHINIFIQIKQKLYRQCDRYYTNINCVLPVKKHLATYHVIILYARYKTHIKRVVIYTILMFLVFTTRLISNNRKTNKL